MSILDVIADLFMIDFYASPRRADYIIILFKELGARGPIIVGTHGLVSRASTEPMSSMACYGIVSYESFPVSPSFIRAKNQPDCVVVE
jgi:hypothetical protein